MKYFLSLTILLALLIGCSKDDEVICTNEFRFVGLLVTGDSLTEYYTVRNSNNDTLRFDQCISYPEERWYLILDDSYSETLKNNQENFRFIGLINDSLVIDENYLISADDCHINKDTGEREVTL